jgi:phosphoenolpyruvate carboxylase
LLQYDLSDMARETLSLFKLMVRIARSQGVERFGGHVISMTHYPSDVLAVWWFWQWAWKATPGDHSRAVDYLPIVPLFETIDDLRHGPEILESLVALPTYRDYLRTSKETMPTQIVMVGYSDSTKDGGYLAASWGLFRVQERLAEVTARHGLRLVVFHGRGGALGRGGGPAARAIMSLPPKSVGGALRMTEQGEVLAERYDDPQIARRHLEQVTWATLLVSGEPQPPVPEEWFALIDRLAERSFVAYRQLVEHPGFLPYFDQATPISEIERLPIGSRPSRRRERKSLSDLRAIPWTFAWTQSRQFIPAWYGLGTALLEDAQGRGDDWSQLQSLYERWALFQAVIDNAVLALAKADLGIARRYAELADDHPTASAVWALIEAEFLRSQAAVLMITREPTLLAGTPWLQRSIQERNPSVDPLNLMQIELIRRMRAAMDAGQEDAAVRLGELIRLTIQGVASGLRTTG